MNGYTIYANYADSQKTAVCVGEHLFLTAAANRFDNEADSLSVQRNEEESHVVWTRDGGFSPASYPEWLVEILEDYEHEISADFFPLPSEVG